LVSARAPEGDTVEESRGGATNIARGPTQKEFPKGSKPRGSIHLPGEGALRRGRASISHAGWVHPGARAGPGAGQVKNRRSSRKGGQCFFAGGPRRGRPPTLQGGPQGNRQNTGCRKGLMTPARLKLKPRVGRGPIFDPGATQKKKETPKRGPAGGSKTQTAGDAVFLLSGTSRPYSPLGSCASGGGGRLCLNGDGFIDQGRISSPKIFGFGTEPRAKGY